jgi:hypothetical protein
MCTRINPEQLVANPDDKIGDVKEIKGACAPAGSGRDYMSHLIPQNGEYEWAGEGTGCHYCSLAPPSSIDCGFGCDGINCCAIYGTSGTYKRKSYNADPIQCCIQGTPMINGSTCDPEYLDLKGSSCYKALKDYCIVNNNAFTKDVCNTWCSNNTSECNTYKSKYCNDPKTYKDPECKPWCMKNMGLCDDGMYLYCKDNPTDTICSCINSDLITYKYNPICQDKVCIDTGYQTTSMTNARGKECEIIDCGTYFNIKNGGKVQLNDINIEERCGKENQSQQFPRWLIITLVVMAVLLVVGSVLLLTL